MNWQPIETAPKDKDILVWFDHDADLFQDPNDPLRLTDYAANAEGGDFLNGKGFAVAKWFPQQWESQDEYGSGYWLSAGYEAVCNPTHWMPLPEPPSTPPCDSVD